MTGGARGVGDEQRRLLPGVAARASLIGGGARFVNAVAIDATARAGVLGLLLGVALGAWLGSERRRLMRAVAAFTWLVGVQAHSVGGALWLVVAAQARRGLVSILAERVAILARRRGRAAMQRRHDGGVASFAQRRGWRREPAVTVAVGARNLAEVRCVAGAAAHVAVGDGHLLRRAMIAAGAAGGDREDDEPPSHGRDPIGWHIRHGIAASGSLLDQPVGWGLPPTPPTL